MQVDKKVIPNTSFKSISWFRELYSHELEDVNWMNHILDYLIENKLENKISLLNSHLSLSIRNVQEPYYQARRIIIEGARHFKGEDKNRKLMGAFGLAKSDFELLFFSESNHTDEPDEKVLFNLSELEVVMDKYLSRIVS